MRKQVEASPELTKALGALLNRPPRVDTAIAELDRRRDEALEGLRQSSEQAHASFRRRLAAASYSRAEMATVMAETLRELGYDVCAWTTLAEFTVRDEPEFTEADLDDAKSEGYALGQADGPDEDDIETAHDEGYDEGVKTVRAAVEKALESL